MTFFKLLAENKDTANLCKSNIQELKELLQDQVDPIFIFTYSYMKNLRRMFHLQNEYGQEELAVDFLPNGLEKFRQILGVKNFIVIGQVPTVHGLDLYDQLTRPKWLSKSINDLKFSQIIPNVSHINAALSKSEFIFLNPQAIFCENEKCINIDDLDKLLYSDNNHLSTFGSVYFIKNSDFLNVINTKSN